MKVNKFKKQLIAVGLSAVTAVTMVSTVFADEETTNPNTADSTTQVQDVNETKKDDINSENLQNENNDTESTNDSSQEVVNNEVIGQSDESEVATDTKEYYLDVIEDDTKVYTVKLDGVSSGMSESEIKKCIENNYLSTYTGGKEVGNYTISEGDSTDDSVYYSLKLYLIKDHTFDLVITKDGVEQPKTTFTLCSAKNDYYAIERYLLENYVPRGYEGKLSGSSGNTYNFNLTKKNNPDEGTNKKYTLKIFYPESDLGYGKWGCLDTPTEYKNARVEYQTFEYDSQASEYSFVQYIYNNFKPEGYRVYNQYYEACGDSIWKLDDDNWILIAYKENSDSTSSKWFNYRVNYIDEKSKETVGSYEFSLFEEEAKNRLTPSEINSIPVGYEFVGNSYSVSGGNDSYNKSVDVTVKKINGESKVPVKVYFYVSTNGNLEYKSSKETTAEDLDINGDGYVEFSSEISNIAPEGYTVSNMSYVGKFGYRFNGIQAYKIEVSCYLEPKSSLILNEEENTATLNDSQALSTLVDSLDTTLKTKYDQAIGKGKEVKFVPTITTANLDSKSEKAVKAEASKLGYSSVEVFDITLAMNIDGEQAGTITETSSPLTFKVTIPETLKKDGRKFYVLRYHDGEVTKLDVSEDGTFTTDKFSVYMLVYEDVKTIPTDNKKEDTSKEENSNTSNSDKTGTDSSKTNLISTKDNKKTTTDSKKSNGVNTSTRTNGSLFVGFSALALTGAAIVGVLKKKNELD